MSHFKKILLNIFITSLISLTFCRQASINLEVWRDKYCEEKYKDNQYCKTHCIMLRNKLIDTDGHLYSYGMGTFFPGLTNEGKALLIHYCYTIKATDCLKAFELMQCLYRAHALKITREPTALEALKNKTLPVKEPYPADSADTHNSKKSFKEQSMMNQFDPEEHTGRVPNLYN